MDQGGQVGAGQEFDGIGIGDFVQIDDSVSLDIVSKVTVTTWVKARVVNSTQMMVMKGDLGGPEFAYSMYLSPGGQFIFGFQNSASHLEMTEMTEGANLLPDTWYQLTATYDDTTNSIVMYVNGIVVGDDNAAQPYSMVANNLPLTLGSDIARTFKLDGNLDEVRISNEARSGQWISTAYKNQNNPGVAGFLASVGTQETSPGATWAAAEDTIFTLAKNIPKRLRIGISSSGTEYATGTTYRLEILGPDPASCSAGSYSSVPTDTSGHWQVVDVANITDGVSTFNLSGLTDANTTFVPGEMKDAGNQTTGITLTNTEFTEIEFAIQATANATTGAQYCFRVTNAGSATNFTYSQYAQVSVAGVALTGTVTDDLEADIRVGGSTIILTVTGNTWIAAGAAFDAERQNIINGIDSAQAEPNGWDAMVKAGLAVSDVVRTSDTVVTITLPAFPGYDISAQETITATVPGTALAQASSAIVAAPTFDVALSAGTVALTGTVTDDEELDIRAGGSTIVMTLADDSWVAAGPTFDAERQNIINGIDSAQAEANGWDAVVKAGLAVSDVVRTSNTVVMITLPGFAGYDISAQETITATVPASALVVSPVALVAAPTFDVAISAGTVALTGTVTDDQELDIRAGGSTIILTLADDSWVAAGAAFNAQRQNIINGLDSAQAEGNGWDAVVQAGLAVSDVVRTSNTVVTVTLPAFASYDITAQETITATMPATALVQSAIPIVATPTFNVTVSPGTVALTGTVTNDSELDIRTGGSTIVLTLTDDTWVVAGATFDAQRQNLINGLDSAQVEANGWDAVVQAGLAVSDVVRTSNTVVSVTLPAFSSYDITAQ